MSRRVVNKLEQARQAAEAVSQAANDAQAAVVANVAANAAAAAAAAVPAAAAAAAGNGGAAPAPPDIAVVLAAVLAQNSQMLQQQALQATAALAQQESARLGAALAAAEALAQQRRAAAGAAPLFLGQARDIAVHTWLVSLERWFDSAHVTADSDAERIEVAATALRGPAQTWWESVRKTDAALVAAGQPTALGTWSAFTAEVRKHFLPQSPELWALQQLEKLTSSGIKDVARYTNEFVALDMLISPQSMGELVRVVSYQRGLPELYRVRAAEKQHATLALAIESTTALWNAKNSAAAAGMGGSTRTASSARINTVDGDDEEPCELTTAAAAAAGAATAGSTDSRTIERIFAMLTARDSDSNSHTRGSRGTRGSGADRNRQKQRGGGASGRRRSRSRTPDVTEAQARERLVARVCIKCAPPGHYARDCENTVRKEDGLPK
jgi:hypothetical protein